MCTINWFLMFCSYVASNLQVVVVSFLFPTVMPLKETTGFPKYTPKLETKVVYIGGGGFSQENCTCYSK